jgi:GntR family transcriptional repressor for pyruvate dehydrogenase complex
MRNLIYANIEGEKEYTLALQTKILRAVEQHKPDDSYNFSVELLNRNMEVYEKYYKSTI